MKRVVFSFLLILSASISFAQDETTEEKKGFQKDRLFVGGYMGLTFGSYTMINISPQLGYRFTDHLAAGLGINGQYISVKNYYLNGAEYSKSTQGVTGLNIFGRVYPVQQFMLQIQPEANYIFGDVKYYDGRSPSTTKLDAMIVPSLLLGGGAVIPSGRGHFLASIFYDILQDKNSPYGARPIYNFGFNIGL